MKLKLEEIQVLNKEEEARLLSLIEQGDNEAKEELIKHNQKLVLSRAIKKKNRGVLLDDLIAMGNVGLLEAIKHFKVEKGNAFSTYATFWIDQVMGRGIDEQRNIIVKPVWVMENMRMVTNVSQILEQTLQRKPTVEEITKALNGALSEEQVIEIIKFLTESISSLDKVISSEDGNNSTVGDFVSDESSPNPEELLIKENQKQILWEEINKLPPLMARCLILKFSYTPNGSIGEEITLEKVADLLFQEGIVGKQGERITKQYVSLLIHDGYKKLQKNKRLREAYNKA